MTGLIAIDESGDLGSAGTEYFAMAAIVMLRPRDLKKAADLIPKKDYEVKWNNSLPSKRSEILQSMGDLRFRIVYTVVNKNHPDDNRPIYGNQLYEAVFRQVVSDAISVLPCKDFNLFLDSNYFMTIDTLRRIVRDESSKQGVNPKKIDKVQSEQNKCIQLVDFIAGAVKSRYESSDDTLDILNKKISIARRH